MHRMLVLALCLLLMVSKIASQEHRLALVIGNAEYKSQGRLKNPVNDAKKMKEVLEKLGFEVIYMQYSPKD